jgi:hypothetical protein
VLIFLYHLAKSYKRNRTVVVNVSGTSFHYAYLSIIHIEIPWHNMHRRGNHLLPFNTADKSVEAPT